MIAKIRRAIEIAHFLEEIKVLYKEQDEIIEGLVNQGFMNGVVVDGKVINLIDNYANKNVAFKTVAYRRYELMIMDHKGSK